MKSDPGFAPAFGMAAQVYVNRNAQGAARDIQQEACEGLRLAKRAIALDREDPAALSMAGHAIAYFGHEHTEAVFLVNHSVEINPNSAFACLLGGWVHFYAGNGDAAISFLKKGVRLSPRDKKDFVFSSGLAYAHFLIGEYSEAVRWASLAIAQQPIWLASYKMLAACQALQGNADAARIAGKKLLAANPNFRATQDGTHWASGEARERYWRGLSIAGLPDA